MGATGLQKAREREGKCCWPLGTGSLWFSSSRQFSSGKGRKFKWLSGQQGEGSPEQDRENFINCGRDSRAGGCLSPFSLGRAKPVFYVERQEPAQRLKYERQSKRRW